FALLPQCRFLGRQRAVERTVKPVRCLHHRPRSPTQAGTTPVRRNKNSASLVALKRKSRAGDADKAVANRRAAGDAKQRPGKSLLISSRREPQGYGCFVQPSCCIQPVITCLVSGHQPSSGAVVAIICLLVSP